MRWVLRMEKKNARIFDKRGDGQGKTGSRVGKRAGRFEEKLLEGRNSELARRCL